MTEGDRLSIWQEYNRKVIAKVRNLLKEDREKFLTDLHIHSDYSADGGQSLVEIIERTSRLGFDIISITDHDSIEVYNELFDTIEMFENRQCKIPIIITGVEFSVSFKEYGDMCHILKYFINPLEDQLRADLKRNETAYWIRCNKQFQRVTENKCLQYFANKHGIHFSLDDYKAFLQGYKMQVPEYPTLMDYIFSVLKEKGVTVGDILRKSEEYTALDPCEKRKEKRNAAIKRFRTRYAQEDIDHTSRFLMPILAPMGIDDDDFPDFESSGSLSVNEYNQIDIFELHNAGLTVFAHPTGTKIDLIDKALNIGGKLVAVELNRCNRHAKDGEIIKKANEKKLLITKGSDSHTVSNNLYEDLQFYEVSKAFLEEVCELAEKTIVR